VGFPWGAKVASCWGGATAYRREYGKDEGTGGEEEDQGAWEVGEAGEAAEGDAERGGAEGGGAAEGQILKGAESGPIGDGRSNPEPCRAPIGGGGDATLPLPRGGGPAAHLRW